MSHGRHAAPSRPVLTKDRVLATGALLATTGSFTGTVLAEESSAQASTTHDWSGVAQCESSGNWHINSGNGFFGGLQFTPSTWAGYGGTAFAPRADLATEAQQIATAERVLVGQGIGAWPVCGKKLTGGATVVPAAVPPTSTRVVLHPQPGKHTAPPPVPAPAPTLRPSDPVYTVVAGDCLSLIAQAHGISTAALYNVNRDRVSDPNLIFAGQKLRLPGSVTVPVSATRTPAHRAPVTAASVVPTAPAVTQLAAHAAPVTDPLPGHRLTSHTTTPGIQEVDLAAPPRTPIYSATSGTVVFAQGSGVRGFGGWIVVRSVLDGTSYDFVYGHEFSSGILVSVGEPVSAGEQIGNVGQNGNATGPHVCFWIWKGPVSHGTVVDPVPFMAAHGVTL